MPAVRGLQRIRPFVWIPPVVTANYRITVESDGVEEDITDIAFPFTVEDGVTDGIGNFEFTVPNVNETYTKKWTGMEIFRYYCDYASGVASTLRFRGRLENPRKNGNNVTATGRSETLFVHGTNIQRDYQNVDAGAIIFDLFTTYAGGRFDLTEINQTTGILLTFTFSETPFWDAIEAVSDAAGYDCFVSALLVAKFFERGTILNTEDALVHDKNILFTGDFTDDVTLVKNKFKIVGGTIGGVQVRHTANDTESQNRYGVRDETINDDGIITYAAAVEFGDSLLDLSKNPPQIGEVRGIMLATIQPGDSLLISDPLNGIDPKYYKTRSFIHAFTEQEGLTTQVVINKSSRKVSRIFRENIQRAFKKTNTSGDTDDLGFSEIELFDDNSGTHLGTEIVGGLLRLASGQSSGTWTSYQFANNTTNINKVKLNIFGDNISDVTIEISVDNGGTYQELTRGALVTMGAGTSALIRLSLITGATVDSLQFQYSII